MAFVYWIVLQILFSLIQNTLIQPLLCFTLLNNVLHMDNVILRTTSIIEEIDITIATTSLIALFELLCLKVLDQMLFLCDLSHGGDFACCQEITLTIFNVHNRNWYYPTRFCHFYSEDIWGGRHSVHWSPLRGMRQNIRQTIPTK